MKTLLRSMLCCLLALPAYAQHDYVTSTLIFERETITIVPHAEPEPAATAPAPAPADPAIIKAPEEPPKAPRQPVTFSVEVRPEDALKLEYIQALTQLNDTNGVMIAFGAPTIVPLPYFRVQQATDVLFVDDAGVILQIYPGHVPMDISRDIYADKPIKALIYLKNGVVSARDIRPRDVVQSRVFTPPPPLLQ